MSVQRSSITSKDPQQNSATPKEPELDEKASSKDLEKGQVTSNELETRQSTPSEFAPNDTIQTSGDESDSSQAPPEEIRLSKAPSDRDKGGGDTSQNRFEETIQTSGDESETRQITPKEFKPNETIQTSGDESDLSQAPPKKIRLSEAPSNRDKGGVDSSSLTKFQNRSEEEEVRDEKNMPEERPAVKKAESKAELPPWAKQTRGRNKLQGEKVLSEVDKMRMQYHNANPVPDDSIGIFYLRSEAVRGPGKPAKLPASCYDRSCYAKSRPLKGRAKSTYYTDF